MESKSEQMQKILQDRGMEILFARVASNLLEKENIDEAVKICENGLKKFPMYAQGHYVLARAYQSKGKNEEARAELERVIKYDPNHLSALLRLVEIYREAGVKDQYQEKLSLLLVLDPFNPEVQNLALSGKVQTKVTPGDPLDVSKIDLDQFDNQEDDFTTIIQGKQAEPETGVSGDESIDLKTGVSAAEMKADTELKQRLAYEGEKRIIDQPGSGSNDESPTFEDLEELQFNLDTSDPEKKSESRDNWAMEVGENEATEILVDPMKRVAKKPVPAPEPADDEEGSEYKQPKIVTQTLGEILVSQKKYTEALRVFETLQKQQPDNKNILKKVDFLKKIVALEQK